MYLTETQERRLRPLIDEVPGRRAIIPTYPRARLRGTVTLPSGQVLTAPPVPGGNPGPQTRLFPFYFSTIANTRRSWSTPRLIGPVLIRKIYFHISPVSDPPQSTLEIGWAKSTVAEAGVALTVPRPYTSLTEYQLLNSLSPTDVGTGLIHPSIETTRAPFEWTLDLLVIDPEPFIVLATVNSDAVNTRICAGHVLILEHVDPNALPFA